jgi:hypothetical protein
MESFLALLQKNVLDRQRWASREELRTGDHPLDREDSPPTSTATPPGTTDTDGLRDAHPRRSRGLTTHPTSQPEWGQSPAVMVTMSEI